MLLNENMKYNNGLVTREYSRDVDSFVGWAAKSYPGAYKEGSQRSNIRLLRDNIWWSQCRTILQPSLTKFQRIDTIAAIAQTRLSCAKIYPLLLESGEESTYLVVAAVSTCV